MIGDDFGPRIIRPNCHVISVLVISVTDVASKIYSVLASN